MNFSGQLRETADALERGTLQGEVVLIVRLQDGSIVSEDSGMGLFAATRLAADWIEDVWRAMRELLVSQARGDRPRRCNGRRQ